MKVCTTCGQAKPSTPEYFHRDRSSVDGLVCQCKKCVSERGKEWRKNNPEKIRANHQKWDKEHPGANANRAKKWREANTERAKELVRRWLGLHQEEVRARKHDYYQNNKEHLYKRHLEYNAKNPERMKAIYRRAAVKYKLKHPEQAKEWAQKHPGIFRLYCNRFRARKRGLPYSLTEQEWNEIYKFFNGSCAYCGKPEQQNEVIQQDHIIPSFYGGSYEFGNIVPACKSCNSSKSNNDIWKWYSQQPFYDPEKEEQIKDYIALAYGSSNAAQEIG